MPEETRPDFFAAYIIAGNVLADARGGPLAASITRLTELGKMTPARVDRCRVLGRASISRCARTQTRT